MFVKPFPENKRLMKGEQIPAMRKELIQIIKRIDLSLVGSTTVGVLLSYFIGGLVTGLIDPGSKDIGALWAAASCIVVLQGDFKTSLSAAWIRVLGTFIGVLIAYAYMEWFPFSPLGMALSVSVLISICMLLKMPDSGRLAVLNMVVILIISIIHKNTPPYMNCLLRFIEATVGTGIGIALAWIISQIPAKKKKEQSPDR